MMFQKRSSVIITNLCHEDDEISLLRQVIEEEDQNQERIKNQESSSDSPSEVAELPVPNLSASISIKCFPLDFSAAHDDKPLPSPVPLKRKGTMRYHEDYDRSMTNISNNLKILESLRDESVSCRRQRKSRTSFVSSSLEPITDDIFKERTCRRKRGRRRVSTFDFEDRLSSPVSEEIFDDEEEIFDIINQKRRRVSSECPSLSYSSNQQDTLDRELHAMLRDYGSTTQSSKQSRVSQIPFHNTEDCFAPLSPNIFDEDDDDNRETFRRILFSS